MGQEASTTITKECERLLCSVMKRIFFGAGSSNLLNNSGMMVSVDNQNVTFESKYPSFEFTISQPEFVEVWDNVGESSFRGFIYQHGGKDKAMFLFFEQLSKLPLKDGLLALIELASDCYGCDRLVICLDRQSNDLHALIRDLGWFGFELSTLRHWKETSKNHSALDDSDTCTSERWVFLGMEL